MLDFFSNPYVFVFAFLALGLGYFVFQKVQEIRASLNPERFRILIINDDQSVEGTYAYRITEGKNTFFDVDGVRYRFPKSPRKVYRVGRLRVPTVYYQRGITTDAISLAHDPEAIEKDADRDYKAALQNNSIRILIDSFRQQFLDAQTSFMIIIVAIIGSAGVLYYLLNQKMETILRAAGA